MVGVGQVVWGGTEGEGEGEGNPGRGLKGQLDYPSWRAERKKDFLMLWDHPHWAVTMS